MVGYMVKHTLYPGLGVKMGLFFLTTRKDISRKK